MDSTIAKNSMRPSRYSPHKDNNGYLTQCCVYKRRSFLKRRVLPLQYKGVTHCTTKLFPHTHNVMWIMACAFSRPLTGLSSSIRWESKIYCRLHKRLSRL